MKLEENCSNCSEAFEFGHSYCSFCGAKRKYVDFDVPGKLIICGDKDSRASEKFAKLTHKINQIIDYLRLQEEKGKL